MKSFNLEKLGITFPTIYRNLSVPALYEMAIKNEKGSIISDKGALIVYSGETVSYTHLDVYKRQIMT